WPSRSCRRSPTRSPSGSVSLAWPSSTARARCRSARHRSRSSPARHTGTPRSRQPATRSTRPTRAHRSGKPSASRTATSGSASRRGNRRGRRTPETTEPGPSSGPGSGRHCVKRESADEGWLSLGNFYFGLLLLGGGRAIDIEQVADALERPDSAGLARGRAQLASDARHPHAQGLEVVAVLRAPDLGQELRVHGDLARVGGQVLEEQPLGAGELDQLAVARDHAPLEIDLDVVELDDARARLCSA